MLSKIANWTIWTAFIIVVTIFVYQQTDWVKPAAAGAKSTMTPSPSNRPTAADKLNSARGAFARGEEGRAVMLYKEYLKTHAKHADAHGELGNVYYLTGQRPEAAQAYYEAAHLLLDERKFNEVASLLQIIMQINPLLADELTRKLPKQMGMYGQMPAAAGTLAQKPSQSALTVY